MQVPIDISGLVSNVGATCTQPRITLPGGAVVQGIAPQIGTSPLESSRATISAATAALAPLGAIFAVIEAALSLIDFAKTVPKVVTNPSDVIEAVSKVVKKAGKLASLVPQLSVPIMVLNVVDLVLLNLDGLSAEVVQLQEFEERIVRAEALSETVPSLGPIANDARAQLNARRSQLSCALTDTQPLIGTISKLGRLIGLPPITLEGDAMSGTLDDLRAMLSTLSAALHAFRSKIPL